MSTVSVGAMRRYSVEFIQHPWRSLPSALALARARFQLRGCDVVGRLTRVYGRVVVSNEGRIEVGERVRIRAYPWATELAAIGGGELRIGPGTFINSGVSISACESVTIGRDCAIGTRVLIMDNDFHVPGSPEAYPRSAPVVLEDRVWVASGVIILKGVRIGEGASVGAGSVVTRDVARGAVVGGVPARSLRTLVAEA